MSPVNPVNPVPSRLRSLSGDVFEPGDAGYVAATAPHNRAVAPSPAAVVVAADTEDVVEAVRAARELGLGLAVQGTGHGIAGPSDGALLVNTSRMRDVVIDPERRSARVGAGARWSDVIPVAAWFGLAPLNGTSPSVGVVGYTLGGGIGWMARRYGFACDSVLGATLVTAGGDLLHVSAASHPDLFWALRGGAGNLGVVTELEFTLYPVADLYGGGLYYPIERAGALLGQYANWTTIVPDTLTSRVALVRAPDAPFVPAPLRGRWVAALQAAFLGSDEDGAALRSAFDRLGAPLLNTFARMPYTSIGTIANEPPAPTPVVMRTALLPALTAPAIDALLASIDRPDRQSLAVVEIRHLGGALAAPRGDASAAGHRDARFWLNALAVFGDPRQLAAAEAEVDAVDAAIGPHATGRVFANGLNGPGSERRVRLAWAPDTYRRLQAVKRRWDPDNVFRFNRNVPPAPPRVEEP